MISPTVLDIKNRVFEYYSASGPVPALRGVDIKINSGETVALIGESGCGKSTLALSVLRLIEPSEKYKSGGKVILNTAKKQLDLTSISERNMQKVRGKQIALVLQDPFNTFNPVIKIGKQMKEAFWAHKSKKNEESKPEKFITEKLEKVHLPAPRRVMNSYPHQLSGGMLQRAGIAAALLHDPPIIIADEPTSNLDVTIQKKVLSTLLELKQELKLSLLYITHDLNLIAGFSDRIYILYAGKIVETASTERIFNDPAHPYTRGLLNSLPDIKNPDRELVPIRKNVPSPENIPGGCPFNPRCPIKEKNCEITEPKLLKVGKAHRVRCFKI